MSAWSRSILKKSRCAGSALLAVVAITAAVAIILMSLLYQLTAEQSASFTTGRAQQAWATALSGVQHAAAVVAGDPYDASLWQDNEAIFRDQLVADDGVERWYFSVFVTDDDPAEPWRYGVSDEAARLHLTEADTDTLAALPGMTPERSEAVRTYLATGQARGSVSNEDDDVAGTETEPETEMVFGGGPVTPVTLDELLAVPGFNASLMYGRSSHAARRLHRRTTDNGTLDGDPDADRGLRDWLTVWSRDPRLASDGREKVVIDQSLGTLTEAGLPEDAAAYVQARREAGDPVQHPAELLEAEIEVSDGDETVTLASGITGAELGELLDRFGPVESLERRGRINVNTAPAPVLTTLPGIDEELAERIVTARGTVDNVAQRTPGWLYTEQLLNADTFISVAPHVTTRCAQIRLMAVGYAVPSGTYRLLEAVVDLTPARPQVLYLRDRTQLGLPFALNGDADGSTGVGVGVNAIPRGGL